MKRTRLRWWATLIACALTLTVLAVPATEVSAGTPVGAYQCKYVDQDWPIQEGSIWINTAYVTTIGRLCSNKYGHFNLSKTWMSMTIHDTTPGAAAGFDYWGRAFYHVEWTHSFITWRFWIGYHVCSSKFSWSCNPDGKFSVKARYVDTRDQRPFLYRRWICCANEWGDKARWG